MSEEAARVVLLVRPGPARDRLVEALDEIDARPALVADPTQARVEDVMAIAPDAVLVVLDTAVEEALDAFDALLSDARVTVIYDEAELVAQRSAWDHARWLRHLRAKLNRHDDVLPPGAERDADWHPLPGRLQASGVVASDLDLAAFAGEAQARAGALPTDGVSYRPVAQVDAVQDAGLQVYALPGSLDMEWTASGTPFEPTPISLDLAAEDFPIDVSVASTGVAGDAVALDIEGLSAADIAELEGLSLDDERAIDGPTFDGLVFDDADSLAIDGGEDATATDPVSFGDSGLELVDDDAAPDAMPGPDRNQGFVRDLDELDRAVAGIALADVDTYGHGPVRGAVVIEGGLGGPDAVRQLLAEIPASFPRPLLVRLRLDGGRYDRLVTQMQRATGLGVRLAQVGDVAEAGHAYFMPPTLGIDRQAANLVFVESDGPVILDALPPADSAWLFLSGSDALLVETAMQPAWSGALVAGQAPEGCYDAMASTEVIARGGASGSPSELAERLTARWPS